MATKSLNRVVVKEPIRYFKMWLEEARSQPDIKFPNAMFLATATKKIPNFHEKTDKACETLRQKLLRYRGYNGLPLIKSGFPTARIVALKEYDRNGFKFVTNSLSKKARDMEENPIVAAAFYWEKLNKIVRIEGCVEKMDKQDTNKYFYLQSIQCQLEASTSCQSAPIESSEELTKRKKMLENEFVSSGLQIPIPPWWTGYVIRPKSMEFYHKERIRFRKLLPGDPINKKIVHEGEDGWYYELLSP